MNWQATWREKIVEPIDELQEKARQQWLALAPRERMILSIMASVLGMLLAILVIKEAFVFFTRHEESVQSSVENIGEIQKLSSEISRQRSDLLRYERLRNLRGPSFQLNSYLEAEARRYGIAIEKISPTKSRPRLEGQEEEWVIVQLNKDTRLDSALKFLRKVEEPIGLRLAELTMKPQFADPTKLEITVTVASVKGEEE